MTAASLRLSDLIADLGSGVIVADSVIDQLDPNLSDEIRALVAHRRINLEKFLASVLLAFALDIADEVWSRVIRRSESLGESGEAAALTDVLNEAMLRMLQRGLRLGDETPHEPPIVTRGRRVG
jgi:hypothetical protein